LRVQRLDQNERHQTGQQRDAIHRSSPRLGTLLVLERRGLFVQSGPPQLVTVDKAVLVRIDDSKIGSNGSSRLSLADPAIAIGVQLLDEESDPVLDDLLPRRLQLVGVQFTVLVLIGPAEEIVGALQFAATTRIVGAHLKDSVDQVRRAALRQQVK